MYEIHFFVLKHVAQISGFAFEKKAPRSSKRCSEFKKKNEWVSRAI